MNLVRLNQRMASLEKKYDMLLDRIKMFEEKNETVDINYNNNNTRSLEQKLDLLIDMVKSDTKTLEELYTKNPKMSIETMMKKSDNDRPTVENFMKDKATRLLALFKSQHSQ